MPPCMDLVKQIILVNNYDDHGFVLATEYLPIYLIPKTIYQNTLSVLTLLTLSRSLQLPLID